jgi:hypothetical protein
MTTGLKQLCVGLPGLVISLFLAGNANAQDFSYKTEVTPTSCAGNHGGQLTILDTVATSQGTQGVISASCGAQGGTDLTLLNTFVSSSALAGTPDTLSGCNASILVTVTDTASGLSHQETFTGTFAGSFSATTSNVTFNGSTGGAVSPTTPTLPVAFTLGCTKYTLTSMSYTPNPPPTSSLRGAISVHITCEPVCQKPTITCPANKMVECGGDTTPTGTGTATATDPCGNTLNITHQDSFAPGNCAGTGTITRTWTATNSCGQMDSCVQTITIVDTTKPMITCPVDIQVPTVSDIPAENPGAATASDTCGSVMVTVSTTGACPTFKRTFVATDACGNTASCTQTITVQNCGGNQGCTPGFWKNHPLAWPTTGYSQNQTLESVFDVPDSLGLDNVTLIQALSLPGGSTLQGAAQILFRAAVAALLNSAKSGISYPLTTAQVISEVNTALASLNRSTILNEATRLDQFNNLGCPINGKS